jgi:hypothetical protein
MENGQRKHSAMLKKNWKTGLIVVVAALTLFWVFDSGGPDAITALATLVMALLTLTIARANDSMASANQTLATIASGQESSIKKQQRAYFDSGPGGGENVIATMAVATAAQAKTRVARDGKMVVRLQITNHGRTPGTVIRMCWLVRPLKNLPKVPVYERWLEGGMKISPYHVFTTRYEIAYELDWPDGQYVSYGRVDYRDVFGDSHSVGFLLTIKKKSNGDDFSHPPLVEGYEKYWEEN